MRSLVYAALIAAVVFGLHIACGTALAQEDSYYPPVRNAWHDAGFAETHGDWLGAAKAYQKAIDQSSPLPLHIREWFRGTAAYGIARCAARMNDPKSARAYLAYAFDHHFWNSSLIKLDSCAVAVCGATWLDSLAVYWREVCNKEQLNWRTQDPFIFYPTGYDSTARWPLLIAMHGGNGNYENFAEYWRPMATVLHAVIVVPPGEVRESEITNSWGADMKYVEKPILGIAKAMIAKHLVDSSKIYLTGFSQGAQASIELAVLHPEIFRGAIAMAGFTSDRPTDSALQVARKRGTRIYAFTGEFEDPTFRKQIEDAHTVCLRNGIAFEWMIVPGMIHQVPVDFQTRFPPAWDWIQGQQRAGVSIEPSSVQRGQN